MRTRRALFLAGLGVGLVTCRRPVTEIVLRVDTDMRQGPHAVLTAVQVRYWQSDASRATTQRFELLGSPERPYLPADLGLVPDQDESGTVNVEVTALRDDHELFTRRATAAYVPEHVGLLEVVLADRCIVGHADCRPEEACTVSGCSPIATPGPLPPYAPPDPDARARATFIYPSPDSSTCTSPAEAPLPEARSRTTTGSLLYECVPVGASATMAPGDWPVLPDPHDEPVIYVHPGVGTDGDGTMQRPRNDLAAAIGALTSGGTIALAKGSYLQPMTLRLVSRGTSVTIAGVGASPGTEDVGTTLSSARGGPVFFVAGPHLTLQGLTIRYRRSNIRDVRDFGVDAAQSQVTLRDVSIFGASTGVQARAGSTLIAEHVTIRSAESHGVALDEGSRATLSDLLISETAGTGIVAHNSYLWLNRALVADNALDGIDLLSDAGFTGPTLHCMTGVAILRNGVRGVNVRGPATLDMQRVAISGTRAVSGVGGDGLLVDTVATAHIEPSTTDCPSAEVHGSELVGNRRCGILVSGGTVSVASTRVVSNSGPGIFGQDGATLEEIRDVLADDNGGLGLAVTEGATLRRLGESTLGRTRISTVATSVGATRPGDGLSIYAGASDAPTTTEVVASELRTNVRFGAIFWHVAPLLHDLTGSGNRYGIGVYGVSQSVPVESTVTGTAQAPVVPPDIVRGTLVDHGSLQGFVPGCPGVSGDCF